MTEAEYLLDPKLAYDRAVNHELVVTNEKGEVMMRLIRTVPQKFISGPASSELQPKQVIELFKQASATDWIHDEDDLTSEIYGLRTNLLVSLRRRDDQRFDLRYGYQAVAIVDGSRTTVEPLPLQIVQL